MTTDWAWLGDVAAEARRRLLAIALAAVAFVGLLALLSGCATWTHPTKGAGAWDKDLYDCEVQAAPVQDPMRALTMKQRCMQMKGWRQ